MVNPAERLDPPIVYHRLLKGQTLSALSRAYAVPVEVLIEANSIQDPTNIAEGTSILTPGASRLIRIPSPGATPHQPPPLRWPLRGPLTAAFGPRGSRGRHHEGIDIDGRWGDPIDAAAAGVVKKAGTGRGYGRMVIIDHGGGLTTLYAHASKLLVRTGQRVAQGETIALVGRSGNARGTHLHFEVHRNDRPINPLSLLRRSR